MNQQMWERALLALLLWREARGEDFDTIRAVAWSVRNRVNKPQWWGTDWTSVMEHRAQYSSMTILGDPNTVKWPLANDAKWHDCMDIANEVCNGGLVDMAQGATSYFDRSLDTNPPDWSAKMKHVMDSGNFHFYKEV